jgi:hypothetical protein
MPVGSPVFESSSTFPGRPAETCVDLVIPAFFNAIEFRDASGPVAKITG